MQPEPRRRNVRPEIATARAKLASLTAAGASAETIDRARASLQAAKATAAVRELLHLPGAERMRLASLLLTGGGDGA